MGQENKEFERIERENMKIAQRLFNKESNISKKELEDEFHSHVKYKHQIQKAQAAAPVLLVDIIPLSREGDYS